MRVVLRLSAILSLMALPFVGAGYSLSTNETRTAWGIEKNLLFILLIAAGLSVLACAIVLFANYTVDYFDSVKKDFTGITEWTVKIAPYFKLLRKIASVGLTRFYL